MGNSEAPAYLQVRNLYKNFGDFTALKDISLDVYESEFVCFLGPSGCGKTTLLRAIAGLDIQSAGTIEQAGRNISSLPPTERDFGIVFQSYALFPNLSVNRNVAYGLENKGTAKPAIVTRVHELLDMVGLADQGDKYPAQLSGGQQQRVALSRALATSPGLLLLDEPLSALDAKVRAHLRHEIKELQQKIGVTTIMVTHDQEEALTMADRIVVMNQGVIDQIGSPSEIYSEPASPFVADFIGTMNFVDGEMTSASKVSLGDFEIDVQTDNHSFQQGDKVKVCLRPEDVAVLDDGDNDQNTVEMTIAEVEFLGSFHRTHFILPGETQPSIRADVSAHRARRLDVRAGVKLRVALQPEFIRLYPNNGSA
jgi:iron(III) transport system ATP-binding protein